MRKAWLCYVALSMHILSLDISDIGYEPGLLSDRVLLYSAEPLHGILLPESPYVPPTNTVTYFFPFAQIKKTRKTKQLHVFNVEKPLSGVTVCCKPQGHEKVTLRNDLYPIYKACVIEFHKRDPLAKLRNYHVDTSRG